MITYFPKIYEDELLYSVFARYGMQSGSMTYRSVAEELLTEQGVSISIEFANQLRPEAIHLLCRNSSLEEMLLKHTMTPYYARFLNKSKREKAIGAVFQMKRNYNTFFSIPKIKSQSKKYLRYCPACVGEEREKYGESYWHRKHQIYGMDVCWKHGCKLIESPVINNGRTSPDFVPAESVVKEFEIRYGGELEQSFACYVSECMDKVILLENDVEIGMFLNMRLYGTKYMSRRGKQRHIRLLYEDFMEVFGEYREGITELWQIEKIINGYRRNPLEIYQLSYFLGISADDLTNPQMPEKSPEQKFDETVVSMISEGKSIYRIQKELQVSSRTIRLVCERERIKSRKAKIKSVSEQEKFNKRLDRRGSYGWR